MGEYQAFLKQKAIRDAPSGIDVKASQLNAHLFPFQADIVRWALTRGRAAIFADCGLGKTLCQLEWARHVPGRVLVLAPLAVTRQTCAEAERFGIANVQSARDSDPGSKIVVTNYHFDASQFSGIVLDESSLLKSFTGKTRNALIDTFRDTPYRLACTATPSPNDFMELGNHAEFLGVMSYTEMLSMFFVHDGGETQKWRLKGHAQDEFWKWASSWGVMLRFPSDVGHDDSGFVLPEKIIHEVRVETGMKPPGYLFQVDALSLTERLGARRESVEQRAAACAEIVNSKRGPFLVWCNLNSESEALSKLIPGSVEVRGSDSAEQKERALMGFSDGSIRVLITKPKIAGFGMNWQHCSNVAFVGLSDSYEQYYQAIRRCWRFGQKKKVHVYIVSADVEQDVRANIERKDKDSERMLAGMVAHLKDINERTGKLRRFKMEDSDKVTEKGVGWELTLCDCVDGVGAMADDSVDYTIYSPPFASLYTYSASDRDMGNSRDSEEFFEHYRFLVRELLRVTKPGRNVSFHCMNLPLIKARDGVIGLNDFRGDLIRLHVAEGWIYHSEVCIWKDPVVSMQRTKALGLLHKQLKKDSCMSRQGIPDYLVTMRKPGVNPDPVSHTNETFPVREWQEYASPVWMDINPSDTLQYASAREEKDERHICPLQLEVIRRGLRLWSRAGDLILSPFAGIGSEGYCAVESGRRFIGFELKESYWSQAVGNLRKAEQEKTQGELFGVA